MNLKPRSVLGKKFISVYDMRIQVRKEHGFTLVELMIVLGIIAMLTVIAIPSYLRYREGAERRLCYQNIAKIEAAKQTWGLENNKTTGDTPADAELYGVTGYIRSKPTCPSTGLDYLINGIGEPCACANPAHGAP